MGRPARERHAGRREGDAAINRTTKQGVARDTAKAELGSLPLNKDAARAQVSKLIEQVAKAVSSAGDAALNAGGAEPAAPIKSAKKAK